MCKHILFNQFDSEKDIDTLKEFAERTHENDGYGAVVRLKNGDIYTYKSLNQGEFYISMLEYIMKTPEIDTLVVHHRTSTNGDGIEYSHPFDFKGYFLTHNGVVQVPKKYKTKTTNDSEQLLHHLVTTNYDTKKVSGYFSVFLVSATKTQVLVDGIAPIYTDGRVYCSHDLSSKNTKFIKLEKSHAVIAIGVTNITPIEVSESDYGRDKKHLSLGVNSLTRSRDIDFDSDFGPSGDYFDTDKDFDSLELFFSSITDHEDRELMDITSISELEDAIWYKSAELGLYLSDDAIADIAEYYLKVA